MESVNVYDAKTRLSQLLARVEQGEESISARRGRPVARLVPEPRGTSRRVLGPLPGDPHLDVDAWQRVLSEPMEEGELAEWYRPLADAD